MSQQINLRSPERKVVRTGFIAIAGAGFYFGLLGVWALTRSLEVQGIEAQLIGLKVEIASVQSQLDARARASQQSELQTLEEQLAALRTEAESTAVWIDALQNGAADLGRGHGKSLRALAGVSVEGVWLQSIDIDVTGKAVSLSGSALDYAGVVRYAQRLNETFAPFEVQFSTLDVSGGDFVASGARGRSGNPLTFRIN
jgi:hypothetical protein